MKFKTQILNRDYYVDKEELAIPSDELSDEADYASSMINQQMAFSLKERDLLKLRKIDKALAKIQKGEYGHCEDCEEPIDDKRLSKQPWADYCLEHAEEREYKQSQFSRTKRA